MPKIRRRKLPPAVFFHLLERADQRKITHEKLEQLYRWMASDPIVPNGTWFKRFDSFTVCGEGELVKTFLEQRQLPFGEEVF
jgi:hypothetical protein